MRCKRVLNIAYCQGIIHVGDHVNNLPPKSAWGEIVDMVILGVIFFHDFAVYEYGGNMGPLSFKRF